MKIYLELSPRELDLIEKAVFNLVDAFQSKESECKEYSQVITERFTQDDMAELEDLKDKLIDREFIDRRLVPDSRF